MSWKVVTELINDLISGWVDSLVSESVDKVVSNLWMSPPVSQLKQS